MREIYAPWLGTASDSFFIKTGDVFAVSTVVHGSDRQDKICRKSTIHKSTFLSSTEASYGPALTALLGKNARRLGRGKKLKRAGNQPFSLSSAPAPLFFFLWCITTGACAEERESTLPSVFAVFRGWRQDRLLRLARRSSLSRLCEHNLTSG